jgi:hypothetical protein
MATMIKYKGGEFTPQQIEVMLNNGMIGEKHDTVQTTFMQPPHGYSQQWTSPPEGGLLTRPGATPGMFSAVPAVLSGLYAQLFMGTTNLVNPEYDVVTGIKASTGSNPTTFCGTPPLAGDMKLGTTRSVFGEFFMGTEKLELNKAGGRVNLGDTDRMLLNNIAAQSPILPGILREPNINTEIGMFIYRFGVTAIRVKSRVLFSGNSSLSNANTETGFIKEFDGFDRLIKTGYIDLDSNNAIPAMDSIVKVFSSADATVAANGIVDLIAQIDYQLMDLASRTGLDPLNIGLAMRPDLFWALTQMWPCSYLTVNCAVDNTTTGRVNVDAAQQVQMRDSMRSGNFLWVNGKQVRVYLEDGIEQTAAGPGFSSTIYFIPFTAGGQRVTYIEGFDQENTSISAFREQAGITNYRTSNGGYWAITNGQTKFCYELYFAAQPRLVMRTPFLAGRIENVVYKLTHGYSRSPYPAEPYFANGGRYVSTPYAGG